MEARVQFREADKSNVIAMVQMLVDDPFGAKWERFESPLPKRYYESFEAINSDPNNELILATAESQIVGVLQLTFIPYLTYQGGWRTRIEGVRMASELRSKEIGREIFQWAISRVRKRGCHVLQLTTDKARPNAIRFYESLGFMTSHEGMKLQLGIAQQGVHPDAWWRRSTSFVRSEGFQKLLFPNSE